MKTVYIIILFLFISLRSNAHPGGHGEGPQLVADCKISKECSKEEIVWVTAFENQKISNPKEKNLYFVISKNGFLGGGNKRGHFHRRTISARVRLLSQKIA